MKLQQMTQGSYFVILPLPIVRAKGWKKGDPLEAKISEKGDIVLKKKA